MVKKTGILALLPCLLFLLACSKPKAPEYRDLKNVRLQKFTPAGPVLSFNLQYFNPNNFRLQLKDADCEVFMDSTYLGHFNMDTLIHVPKNHDFILPVSLKLDIANFAKNMLTAALKPDVLITVKGTIKAGKAGIFIRTPINYQGRHKLDF